MKLEFSLMNDYFIKKLFHQPKYFKILIKFVVGLDIEQEVIETTFAEIKANAQAKGSRFDIRVKFRNTIVDVEGQIEKEKTNPKNRTSTLEAHHTRKIHYASQLHSENYQVGDKYDEKKYTIVIFLVEYDIKGEEAIQVSQYTNQQTKEVYEDIKIYDVCLKKGKKCDSLEIEEFLDVLRTKEKKEYRTPIARELMELIMKWSADEQERMQARLEENYERELATERSLLMKEARQEGIEQGIKRGIKQGIEQGFEQGIAHKEKEMVLAMIEKQMSKEIISEITKLTLGQIEEIIQSQNK